MANVRESSQSCGIRRHACRPCSWSLRCGERLDAILIRTESRQLYGPAGNSSAIPDAESTPLLREDQEQDVAYD